VTHDELLAKIEDKDLYWFNHVAALRAVVELHKPSTGADELPPCIQCGRTFPCPTIEAIEKELG
jgi:hypothetical protein